MAWQSRRMVVSRGVLLSYFQGISYTCVRGTSITRGGGGEVRPCFDSHTLTFDQITTNSSHLRKGRVVTNRTYSTMTPRRVGPIKRFPGVIVNVFNVH